MRKLALAAFLALTVMVVPESSIAATNLQIAPSRATTLGFVFPVVAAIKDQPLTFVQFDATAPHNFVSAEVDQDGLYVMRFGPDGAPWCDGLPSGSCPLFWSGAAEVGPVSRPVDLRNVTAGETYLFFCSAHPYMRGELTVVG